MTVNVIKTPNTEKFLKAVPFTTAFVKIEYTYQKITSAPEEVGHLETPRTSNNI